MPPRTPTHSRHPSNIDLSYATNYSNTNSPRRYSKTSIHSPSPTTPLRHSMNGDSMGIDVFSSGGAPPANGLGNLADELADAWDEDEADEEPDMNFQEMPKEMETTRDSGVDVTEPVVQNIAKIVHLAPAPAAKGRNHHKRKESEYDGSDWGGDSDLETHGISPGLVARMDQIESLARRGTETNGTDTDNVVKRVVDGLRDLGSQSNVEGHATR
jgi:hypothetical protein